MRGALTESRSSVFGCLVPPPPPRRQPPPPLHGRQHVSNVVITVDILGHCRAHASSAPPTIASLCPTRVRGVSFISFRRRPEQCRRIDGKEKKKNRLFSRNINRGKNITFFSIIFSLRPVPVRALLACPPAIHVNETTCRVRHEFFLFRFST